MNITKPIEALWNGKCIKYIPGKLHIALKRGVSHKKAYAELIKVGCKIEYDSESCGVFEVRVPEKETLYLAKELGSSNMFRYVEPEIINKKESYN